MDASEYIKNYALCDSDLRNMTHHEQYVSSVLNYTSKFNSLMSRSYAPENLIGKCEKYPAYGDFIETYMLRSYGNWWKESGAYQQPYRQNDVDPLGAEDYITLRFDETVVPKDIFIYETYNPGAIVRIWGRLCGKNWVLLWEGPPQQCPDEARKFKPPLRKVDDLVNEIRLEINQSNLRYQTALDAVLLVGLSLRTPLLNIIRDRGLLFGGHKDVEEKLEENEEPFEVPFRQDCFSKLPYEVLVHIFEYLDLKSLCHCAQVNKRFYETTQDPMLYQYLSLRRYWNKVNEHTLEYFQKRCRNLKKLDLSWCGNENKQFGEKFIGFMKESCKNLTHLALNSCDFVNNRVIEELVDCSELIELRLRCCQLDRWRFSWISNLKRLVTLDLYSTAINENVLIPILKANPHLKHIVLDQCESIRNMDEVVEVAVEHNRLLESWSSWKIHTLTAIGAGHFARCSNLRELDLGWCLVLIEPGDSLPLIANGCPHLNRLVIAGWRGVRDRDLLPIVELSRDLTQLDLLGLQDITADVCEKALALLPRLRLLDISFCDKVQEDQVKIWRERYPEVTIQRSCQFNDSYSYH